MIIVSFLFVLLWWACTLGVNDSTTQHLHRPRGGGTSNW
jgi:hypothetical protein